MIVLQSAFGSWEVRCFIRPSLRTLSVPFSTSEICSDMDTLAEVDFVTVAGGCGVACVTFVDGAGGDAAAYDNHGAAEGVCDACDAGLLNNDVDGANDVCCRVLGVC